MDDTLFLILLILTAAMLGWGLSQVVVFLVNAQRRKLQERLSHGSAGAAAAGGSGLGQSITFQTEAEGLSRMLVRRATFRKLHQSLQQAYPEVPLTRFLAIAAGMALAMFAVVTLLMDSLAMGVIATGLGGWVPFVALANKRNRRQRLLADQLPNALDFLTRILRAGHSLSTGLQMVAEELPAPLAGEFRRCYDQHSLGLPLEEALKDMAGRVGSPDFAFFVTAVLIQRQTGGDLAEVLNNIGGMIRQRVRLEHHMKAKTAEGRLTGYILVALPAVMFLVSYVLNPSQAEMMLHTGTGLVLVGITVFLEMGGLWAIRKITTVKV